jgi:FecR-like protein
VVSAALLLLLAIGQASPIGVVRVARGDVNIGRGVELRPAESGTLVVEETVIETDPGAWAEIVVLPATRVRVSAATHLEIERKDGRLALALESGRIWIEHTSRDRSIAISTPNARAEIASGTSAILEHARASGTAMAVRAGEAMLMVSTENQAPVRVTRGQLSTVARGSPKPSPSRAGGESLAEIVSLESKKHLGDLIGVKAFLLARVARSSVKGFHSRGVHELLRTLPEIAGGDGGPPGALAEEALRPPPFFENEVPPRGPNVRVKVTYGD